MANITFSQQRELKNIIAQGIPDMSDEVIQWVRNSCIPEDVFSQDELIEWALQNGFVLINKPE